MNALQMAKTAYSGRQAPLRTSRGIEYDLFARNTHRLRQAHAEGSTGFPRLAQALHENRQMWTLLACDVAGSDNGLPAPLRAQIFYLAEFTEQHSVKVLSGKATAEALIEINTAIMRGLRKEEVAS